MTSESTAETLNNLEFRLNYALTKGCAISVLSYSTLASSNSVFTANMAEFTDNQNSAEKYSTSVIYALGTKDNNTIISCTFTKNKSSKTMSFAFANLVMAGSTFSDNIAVSETAGLFITHSTVIITNCHFDNNRYLSGFSVNFPTYGSTQVTGGFLFISVGAFVAVRNCTFKYGYALNGGAIYVSGNTRLLIENSNFLNNAAETSGGDIYLANYNTVNITNVEFSDMW